MKLFKNLSKQLVAGCSLIMFADIALSSNSNPLAQATAIEIASAYESPQKYQITRNGKPIGSHEISFSIAGDTLNINIDSAIKVRILGIPVYSLTYTATETWQSNQLLTASATTVENGDPVSVSLDNTRTGNPVPFASNHWHPQVLNGGPVFNTLTGETDELTILEVGWETVSVGQSELEAMRHRYTGDLNLDSWYDKNGLWVKMAFAGEDGSLIQYLRLP